MRHIGRFRNQFGTQQIEFIPEHLEQRHLRVDIHGDRRTVDIECVFHGDLPESSELINIRLNQNNSLGEYANGCLAHLPPLPIPDDPSTIPCPLRRVYTYMNAATHRILAPLSLTMLLFACSGNDEALSKTTESDGYEYRTASRDGIGKVYQGREISHVMGHLGAGWLERPTRMQEERTDLLISKLPLTQDSIVADIGAGTGYFTFPVARRVPQGHVYAIDIQPEMLAIIEARKTELGVTNIEPVLGRIDHPGLGEATVDLIFIVDAYHEFSHPREMGEAMADALKPGGRLVLIEYRAEDPSVPIKRLLKMTEIQAKREMATIGLDWEMTHDFLPQQHFLVFRKPAT